MLSGKEVYNTLACVDFSFFTGCLLFESLIFQCLFSTTKVQVGKYQEKAQSENDSHAKNRDGKK